MARSVKLCMYYVRPYTKLYKTNAFLQTKQNRAIYIYILTLGRVLFSIYCNFIKFRVTNIRTKLYLIGSTKLVIYYVAPLLNTPNRTVL